MCQCVCLRGVVNQVDASLYIFFSSFMLLIYLFFWSWPLSHLLHQIRPPTAAGASFDLIGGEEPLTSLRPRLASPWPSTLIRADRVTIPRQRQEKVRSGWAACASLSDTNRCVSEDCTSHLPRLGPRRAESVNRSGRVELRCLVSLSQRDFFFNLLSWRPEVNQQKRLLMTLT